MVVITYRGKRGHANTQGWWNGPIYQLDLSNLTDPPQSAESQAGRERQPMSGVRKDILNVIRRHAGTWSWTAMPVAPPTCVSHVRFMPISVMKVETFTVAEIYVHEVKHVQASLEVLVSKSTSSSMMRHAPSMTIDHLTSHGLRTATAQLDLGCLRLDITITFLHS
eukprot:3174448-Amphidinium_carterae.1